MQAGVGLIGQVACQAKRRGEVLDQPGGQVAGQFGGQVALALALALRAQTVQQGAVGVEIEGDLLALVPVGRDLQHRRPRQATMRKQHRLVEMRAAARHPGRCRHARQVRKAFVGKGQRHKRGARFGHVVPELLRDVIGQPGGAHGRDGFAARGHDDVLRVHLLALTFALQRGDKAVPVMAQPRQRGAQPQIGAPAGHLVAQHGDDLPRLAIAKELPQRFLVPADAVAGDKVDEIPLGIAAECGFVEMPVGRDEITRRGVQVGEVASPPARDADLFARGLGMIDHQHARAGMGRAHHAGRPGAKDQRVHFHSRPLPAGQGAVKHAQTGLLVPAGWAASAPVISRCAAHVPPDPPVFAENRAKCFPHAA